MKKIILGITLFTLLYSCREEDPGPRQDDVRSYAPIDFDQLEISDAIEVKVTQGNQFSIHAEGDRRNLDDLQVYKSGRSLVVKFSNSRNRHYTTYVNITMPDLKGISFSGAVDGQLSGFKTEHQFDVVLSGASVAQTAIETPEIYFNISGASQLRLQGTGEKIDGTLSGASLLSAFDYPVSNARLMVSGASSGKVTVSQWLDVDASGASVINYRGNPQLAIKTSGTSVVRQD